MKDGMKKFFSCIEQYGIHFRIMIDLGVMGICFLILVIPVARGTGYTVSDIQWLTPASVISVMLLVMGVTIRHRRYQYPNAFFGDVGPFRPFSMAVSVTMGMQAIRLGEENSEFAMVIGLVSMLFAAFFVVSVLNGIRNLLRYLKACQLSPSG